MANRTAWTWARFPCRRWRNVELLSSGASAIYGSDAIGGVLNFITKRDMDQTEASVSGGMFQQGVGQSVMASVITGNSFERGSFTVGLDGFITEQILASDVDYLKKNAPYDAAMVSIQRNTPPAIVAVGSARSLVLRWVLNSPMAPASVKSARPSRSSRRSGSFRPSSTDAST